MLVLGLTGSIATGKSTVSRILGSDPHKLPIIDADLLASKVVEPGTPGYKAVVKYFGPITPNLLLPADDPACGGEVNGPNGKGRPLNRPVLGKAIFGAKPDKVKARKVLNGIVHPAVRLEILKALVFYYVTGHWAVVLDVPLLFEGPLHYICGTTIVVAVADPEIHIRRLRARDAHLSEKDAKNRIMSQGNVREKAARALARGPKRGVAIWNDGDNKLLKANVDKAIENIKSNSPTWWSWLCLLCPLIGITSAVWNIFLNYLVDGNWLRRERANL